jgi:dolichol-phosphate mannosyltransferase
MLQKAQRMPNCGKTLVAIATFNEIQTLPRLVEQIQDALPAAEILVVDDSSPDGTGRWCEEKAAGDQRLKCLHREGKLGLGTALVAAMRYAVDRRAEYSYLVTMDADFSHPPERLAALLASMDPPDAPEADVAIGSRYTSNGGIDGWPLSRHVLSRAVNLVARWLLWLSPKDCSSGYRCYRVDRLARMDFEAIHSRGYSFEEEVLWRLNRLGARFAEIPIRFVNRRHGASKTSPRELATSAAILLGLAAKTWLRL